MSRHIQLLISDEFAEKIIPENDSVRLCDDIIDEMDLHSLFRTYSDKGRKYEPVSENIMKGKLVELLFHLDQLHRKTIKGGNTCDNVRQIIMYINENIEERLSLNDIADKFFVSKSYLCHLFKDRTGLTINQYIKQKRFMRVKELCSEEVSLTEASIQAGFGTYSNFYKMYLNEIGRAPSADMK